MAFALISSKICSSIFSYTSTSSSAPNYYPWKFSKFRICPSPQTFSCRCKHELSAVDERNFVLHDALDASGMDTTHARGFRRTAEKTHIEQRALYLNSVLTHRSGSVSMLSIIYSEILKMLRIWGVLDFDVEIFFPHDSHSCPRGYQKKKSTESDQLHIMTTQSLLVEMLKDLKNAFWPFQLDNSRSPFLSAAQAAQCFIGPNNTTESAFELASAKAARHRLQRGVWTSVRFGDIRRALAACERLILLKTDPKELRDYAVLLYHCGFYEESLQYLKLYQQQAGLGSSDELEGEEDGAAAAAAAVEELIIRLKLIMMEEGWSRRGPQDSKSILFNNSEPW
ncbi:uncharacterized protein LOC127262573 isoform X3 [Andrographis paniculata]|uniref:uncharacterized protein LOC127262573 isoform X3 n=1 Tax=Andrographis paniculata TaxID=175694 RepID=UPI0021E91BB5|nr:uncharacterized protein LOC127262573 isoform X3 [Andrographis paniculata]